MAASGRAPSFSNSRDWTNSEAVRPEEAAGRVHYRIKSTILTKLFQDIALHCTLNHERAGSRDQGGLAVAGALACDSRPSGGVLNEFLQAILKCRFHYTPFPPGFRYGT